MAFYNRPSVTAFFAHLKHTYSAPATAYYNDDHDNEDDDGRDGDFEVSAPDQILCGQRVLIMLINHDNSITIIVIIAKVVDFI